MNAKENYLEAVRFGKPDHVPMDIEDVFFAFQFEGNFKRENWRDLWGVDWEVGIPGTVPFPKGYPLPSLGRIADYRMPKASDLVFTDQMKRDLAAVDRSQKLVMGRLTYLLFERAWAIMGMDNFFTALYTHPKEMHEYLHGIAHFTREVFDRYLELGVDAVRGSEDLGSQRALMMSPAMFREFLLPEYKYLYENVLRAGKMIYFHSCGCVDAVAADLAGIGITILNPVQARANDQRKVKRETAGRMAIHGGFDAALLSDGTPEQVRAEVVRVMEVLKPGGGYLCGPDQGIPGVKPENVEVFWQTVRDLGKY